MSEKNLYLARWNDEYLEGSIMAGPFSEEEKDEQIKEALIYMMGVDARIDREKALAFIEATKNRNGVIIDADMDGNDYVNVSLNAFGCSIVYGSDYTDSVKLVSYEPKSLTDKLALSASDTTGLTWESLIHNLPDNPDDAVHGIWTNGEEILCIMEAKAEAIADLIDALNIGNAVTGQYDDQAPIDQNSGYYYVGIE